MKAAPERRPDLIDSLNLLLTARCNLKCAYCYQDRHATPAVAWEELRRTVDWALANGGDSLDLLLSGGEPLLVPDLVLAVLDHVARHKPPQLAVGFKLMTNGLQLDEDLFRRLVRHEVEIRLSTDGTAAAQAARGGDVATTLDGICRRLHAVDPAAFRRLMVAVMTVTPAAVPHLADGVAHLLDQGFARVEVNPVLTPCEGWDHPDLAALREQFGRLRELCLAVTADGGPVPVEQLNRLNLPLPDTCGDGPSCSAAGTRNPVADVDGRLYSCTLFAASIRDPATVPAAVGDATCLGRPGTPEFAARFGGHPARAADFPIFRVRPSRSGLFGPCAECEHRDYCHVCPMAFLPDQADSTAQRVPGFICGFHAVAHETWRSMPTQPLPAAVAWQPEVLAFQNEVFRVKAARLFGPGVFGDT